MPRFNGSLQIIAVNSSDASLIRVHLIDLRLDQLGARPVSIDQIVNSPGRRSTTLMHERPTPFTVTTSKANGGGIQTGYLINFSIACAKAGTFAI
jgi:hypothetical protein